MWTVESGEKLAYKNIHWFENVCAMGRDFFGRVARKCPAQSRWKKDISIAIEYDSQLEKIIQ